jgi:hypothetical protein
MRVMPEDVLLGYLERCLALSAEILPRIPKCGTKPAPVELAKRYEALILDLHKQKSRDSILSDESWEWIWEVREDMNLVQVYGRLAWLNYNLFDLL